MNSSIIIVGPKACGKTRNAAVLAEVFGLNKIVEADFPSPHRITEFDALVLCNEVPKSCRHFRCIQYADAVKEVVKAGKKIDSPD